MPLWTCVCGSRLEVSETQAGTTVSCACGSTVQIPSLTVLRRQSDNANGQPMPRGAYSLPVRFGKEISWGWRCALRRAKDVNLVLCFVEYERPFYKKRNLWPFLLFGFIAPLWTLWHFCTKQEAVIVSDGKILEFYLSLCPSCRTTGLNPKELRDVLRCESAFANLFAKHPAATVWTSGTSYRAAKVDKTAIQDLSPHQRHRR